MPLHRIWDLQINRGGKSPTPKGFVGPDITSGRKEGKEGRSLGFIECILCVICCSSPFHSYLIISPIVLASKLKPRKTKGHGASRWLNQSVSDSEPVHFLLAGQNNAKAAARSPVPV